MRGGKEFQGRIGETDGLQYKSNRFSSQGRAYQRNIKQKFERKAVMVRKSEYFWFIFGVCLVQEVWLYFGLYLDWGKDLLSLLENKEASIL